MPVLVFPIPGVFFVFSGRFKKFSSILPGSFLMPGKEIDAVEGFLKDLLMLRGDEITGGILRGEIMNRVLFYIMDSGNQNVGR
jgi:hypothetical protein